MKKIIVLMMAIFLVFSISGFSQGKPHKTVQSAKIAQPKKGSGKTGRAPRKPIAKKKIHKPSPKHQAPKRAGRAVKV
jgi:hypothetical protein